MITEKTLTPAIKWHGGKNYLARRIIALFPPHLHYVEPFFGGGAVLFEKDPEGVSEVVNDLNGSLTNFWRVLQHGPHFAEFHRRIQATPFSENEFDNAEYTGIDAIEYAVSFFIRCLQSLAGRMKSFAPLSRTRTRRGMNEQASAWLGAVDGLPAVHERLKRVVILNHDAIKVIQQQDGADTLFYVDAPYVHASRKTTEDYEFEMTDAQHELLVATMAASQGKFAVSMYHHPIYDALHERHGFTLHEIKIPNHSSSAKVKEVKTECVWIRA